MAKPPGYATVSGVVLKIFKQRSPYGKCRDKPAGPLYRKGAALSSFFQEYRAGNQAFSFRPNSPGRKRGQTFSETLMTEAARRVPISTASRMLLR